MPGCTREDIPALEIVLTATQWNGEAPIPDPHVRMELAGAPTNARTEVRLSAPRRDPAQRVLARAEIVEGNRRAWLSGSLQVERGGPQGPIRGNYRFCEPDARCIEGSFNASWKPRPMRCG